MSTSTPTSADASNDAIRERFRRVPKALHGTMSEKLAATRLRLVYSKAMRVVAQRLNKPVPVTARPFWGDQMTVVLPDAVSGVIYQYRYFEEGLTDTLLQRLRPGMTFFDVGAHMGYFSLLASRLVGDAGQVHSFEPTPRTFKILKANTCRRKNIRLNNNAVFSRDATLELTDFGIRRPAFNTLFGHGDAEADADAQRYDVKAISIDNYCASTGARPDFVKIDAEGAEVDIVEGMRHTLATCRPMLTVEVGDTSANMTRNTQVIHGLVAQGYKAFAYDAGALVPHQPQTSYAYDNILLVAA